MSKLKTYVVFNEETQFFTVVRARSRMDAVRSARPAASDSVSRYSGSGDYSLTAMSYPNFGLWLWQSSEGRLCWSKTPEQAMKLLECDSDSLVKIEP
ncbi:hypothetical protein [Peromfec virus RodF8_52]|uniref:Uncharacterized protein n=1 Tax=Peromfec virus RodF8_52 TaxID=2929381 RepID=A0A976R8R9_9VIRU|nr:hypothetical protein [Peromfec virus RodF8_52]